MDESQLHSQIYSLPKADLHRHIDGSIKPELMLKLSKDYGIKLPTFDKQEFSKLYTINSIDGVPLSNKELFKRFAWSIAVMRHPDALREVAYNQVLDLAEENILFAELRFAPGYHSKYPAPFYKPKDYETNIFPVMSLDEVMENTIAGIEKGMKETGVQVNLTLSIPRETIDKYGISSAYNIATLAMNYQDRGVVALDLACDELNYPPDPYVDVFLSTLLSKIRRDPHAGEMGIDTQGSDKQRLDNILVCASTLFADGLGHAIPLWKDDTLVQYIRDLKIRIERNPWECPAIRGEGEDRTDYLLKENVLISLCSDDPVLMNLSLTDGFVKMINKYNWKDSEVNKIIANSVNSGFYRDKKQEKTVKEMFKKNGILL
jgi:adenosine deaminase